MDRMGGLGGAGGGGAASLHSALFWEFSCIYHVLYTGVCYRESHRLAEVGVECLFCACVRNIITIIIIVLKGTSQDFSQSPHCTVNCLQHVHSSGQVTIMCKSHAPHPVLITCSVLCATWYKGTAQLLSLTAFNPFPARVYAVFCIPVCWDEF